jgi:hypothetical protein
MFLASAQRRKFSKLLWEDKLAIPVKDSHSGFDIISFSGKNEFEEQVLSIYSFVFYVGIPQKWVIYSDGSHTEKEKQCLLRIFPFVMIKVWNENASLNDNKFLKSYLETCHLSKKLHAILGHQYERQTIYVDSDIVFYKNASAYFNSGTVKESLWYIPETNGDNFQENTLNEQNGMFALNSGLMILNNTFKSEYVFEYLENLNFNYGYFTEQSSFDYAFKKQKASVLDPRQFIIDLRDQFMFETIWEADEMALRHYVNPVRHKMWQKGWTWHFKK